MDKSAYTRKLKNKMTQYPKNEYLKYLWDNLDNADLTSKICVEIPAYNDPELMYTVRSCIVAATNPERLVFAVCYQSDDLETLEELKKTCKEKNCEVKIKYFASEDAPGLCAARYECNKLITDETYVLHIDSHMRFSMFWDIGLIQQWRDCNDEKAIISAYCRDYQGTLAAQSLVMDEYLPNNTNGKFINATHFADMTIKLRFVANTPFEQHTSKPRRGAFISGHFLFAKADVDKKVPSDPNMYFVADEISMAVRYYTNGFNIYQPAYRMIQHLFGRVDNMKDKLGVSIQRFNESKKVKIKDDKTRMEKLFRVVDHKDIDLTGFDIGEERSLEDYLSFSGLDFKNRTMRNFTHHGAFDTEHTAYDLEIADWFERHQKEKQIKIDTDNQDKTILVMIAEYKDPHVLDTIRYFKENAMYPDRIRFAVCLQDNDDHIKEELSKRNDCKVICVNPEEKRGVGYCYRQLTDHCIDGEDYVLITEAHMYAVKNWDAYHINIINQLGDKAVISNWTFNFDYANLPKDPKYGVITCIHDITDYELLCIHYGNKIESKYPVRGCAVIGNNIFGKTQMAKDCLYDPEMRMNLSETSMTLQLWTHGYDVYHTPQRYLYHYFVLEPNENDAESDKTRASSRIELRELERKYGTPKLKKYIGLPLKPDDIIVGDEFKPGTERSIKSFELFAGIDFATRRISRRSYTGHFTSDSYHDQGYLDKKWLNNYCKENNMDARSIGNNELNSIRSCIPDAKYEPE